MQNTCMHKCETMRKESWNLTQEKSQSHRMRQPQESHRMPVALNNHSTLLCVSVGVCTLCIVCHGTPAKVPSVLCSHCRRCRAVWCALLCKNRERALHCCWETSTGDIVVSKHRKAIKLAAGETCGNCVASNKSERVRKSYANFVSFDIAWVKKTNRINKETHSKCTQRRSDMNDDF